MREKEIWKKKDEKSKRDIKMKYDIFIIKNYIYDKKIPNID